MPRRAEPCSSRPRRSKRWGSACAHDGRRTEADVPTHYSRRCFSPYRLCLELVSHRHHASRHASRRSSGSRCAASPCVADATLRPMLRAFGADIGRRASRLWLAARTRISCAWSERASRATPRARWRQGPRGAATAPLTRDDCPPAPLPPTPQRTPHSRAPRTLHPCRVGIQGSVVRQSDRKAPGCTDPRPRVRSTFGTRWHLCYTDTGRETRSRRAAGRGGKICTLRAVRCLSAEAATRRARDTPETRTRSLRRTPT
jgi:hypothetical protein